VVLARPLARLALALSPALALPLLVGMASAQPAPAAQPAVVTLKLSEYRFDPGEIDLDHGRPYVLRFSNVGQRAHGFSAKAFFRGGTVAASSAPWVRQGVVEIGPGDSVDIAITAPAAGTYDFDCPHLMNEMLGMKGQIVVR